jgi:hypothetical protein
MKTRKRSGSGKSGLRGREAEAIPCPPDIRSQFRFTIFYRQKSNPAVYDGAMESSFRHPPHQQLLKGQTMISETLKHRQ